MVQFKEEEHNYEKEISDSPRKQIEEILKNTIEKNDVRVLLKWWDLFQKGYGEVFKNIDFSMGGFL